MSAYTTQTHTHAHTRTLSLSLPNVSLSLSHTHTYTPAHCQQPFHISPTLSHSLSHSVTLHHSNITALLNSLLLLVILSSRLVHLLERLFECVCLWERETDGGRERERAWEKGRVRWHRGSEGVREWGRDTLGRERESVRVCACVCVCVRVGLCDIEIEKVRAGYVSCVRACVYVFALCTRTYAHVRVGMCMYMWLYTYLPKKLTKKFLLHISHSHYKTELHMMLIAMMMMMQMMIFSCQNYHTIRTLFLLCSLSLSRSSNIVRQSSLFVCVCVCVIERERKRERKINYHTRAHPLSLSLSLSLYIHIIFTQSLSHTNTYINTCTHPLTISLTHKPPLYQQMT